MEDSTRGADGFAGRLEVIGGSTGRRRWPEHVKARIVRESFAPGASVNAVARRHRITPQQMTGWRRAARDGLLALPAVPGDAPPAFVPLAVDDTAAAGTEPSEAKADIEIAVGRTIVRLPSDADAERIAAVAAALEARL